MLENIWKFLRKEVLVPECHLLAVCIKMMKFENPNSLEPGLFHAEACILHREPDMSDVPLMYLHSHQDVLFVDMVKSPICWKKSNCVKEISNLSESTCFHTASTTRRCRLAGVLRCPSPRREPAWSNTWPAILRLSSQSCLGFLWISNFWRSWSWSCLIYIPEWNGCISGKVTLFRCSGTCHWNHTWLV